MLEDVLNSVITRFLGEYIKDIDKKDLKVSMWKGDVKLKNLEVKTEALDFLQLPVDIKSGFVGELNLSIPWKDIGRKPTKVNISNIFVVVCPRSEIHYDEESYRQRQIELKRQQLKAIDEKEAKKTKELHEKENNSLVANLINKIIRNFEMSIDKIHIRYEDRSSDPTHPFCAGISLEKISISPNITSSKDTPDEKTAKQHNGVFSKDVLIHRFGVYWDSDTKSQVNSSNSISLIEDMELVFSNQPGNENQPKPRNFIIRPFSVAIGVQMDIRGVELRKPSPEEAALSAMKELGWNTEVLVNQNFIKAYCKIKKDGIRGRDEEEETELFIEKFKQKYPKFCSSINLEYGKKFSKICWKYANTASPIMTASATLPQLTIEVQQNQIRDVKILLSALSSQVKRSQYFVNRPTSSIVKKPRKWWKYAISCVMEENKRKKEACSWKDYLKFKKQRNEYINLYKRTLHAEGYEPIHKDKKALKRKQELEDLFSVENVVLFRKMAQVELEKEHVEMKSFSSDEEDEELRTELYEELEISKEDVNAWVGGQPKDILFAVDFSLSSTQIILKREVQKLMDLCVDGVGVRFYKRKEFMEVWAQVYDVKILDEFTPKTRYSSILSIRHPEEVNELVQTPTDEVDDDFQVKEEIVYSKMTANTRLLPSDFRGKKPSPFVQAHVEIPSMDSSSGMRVEAVVQTMDIVVNVPWVLEVLKFFVPDNIIVMSLYEEKAYSMITSLRNGDANLLTVVQNNKGMNIDMLILPINIIIPDSCIAHRSKTQLLKCQIGEVYVDSKPNPTTPDVTALVDADLYNTISVSVRDLGISVVNGRVYASSEKHDADLEGCFLIKPFSINVDLKMCLINELRWVSTDIDIHVDPIVINVTQQLVIDTMNWLVAVWSMFSSKQKELDLDVMAFLLLPKQLLLSCIEFNGSPLFIHHDISSWKTSPQKLQKLLYRVVMQRREEMMKSSQSPCHLNSTTLSHSMVMDSMDSLTVEEKMHGVVHLTTEDLLLVQYKPSMKMDVVVDQISIQLKDPVTPSKSLLDINLNKLQVYYKDHLYDMIIDCAIPSMQILDYSHSTPSVLMESVSKEKDFISLSFSTVGTLSMLNDFYDAATNVRVAIAPLQIAFNAAIVNAILDFLPPLPAFPVDETPQPESPKESKSTVPSQDGILSLQVSLESIQFNLFTDASQSILHLALDTCQCVFYQGFSSTHIVASLGDIALLDQTAGCGSYPEVVKILLEENTSFLTADIMLVKNPLYTDVKDTTIDVQMQTPVVTLRYRFIQELLQYLAHGEIAFVMKRLASPPEPKAEMNTETQLVESVPSQTVDSLSSLNVHKLVMDAVENLFSSLVESSVIREVENGFVLPHVNVSLKNLIMVVPSSSDSQECVKFELGHVIINNQEGQEYGTLALLDPKSAHSFRSEISLRLEGMHLETIYQQNGKLISQTLLHDIAVHMNILLSSVFYCKLQLSTILLSVNQNQLSFILHQLTKNFAEQSVTQYPEEIERKLPVKVKEEKPALLPSKPIEKKHYGVGQAFYVDLIFDSLSVELLKEDGGYTKGEHSQLHPLSVCLFELNSLSINTVLSASTLSVALVLSQILLKDTRASVPYINLFKTPLIVGNASSPAVTLSLYSASVNSSNLNLHVGLHATRFFPSPLLFDLLSLVTSFSSVMANQPAEPAEPAKEESSETLKLSPFVASLLDSLSISLVIDPITVYLSDSLTVSSSFILINMGMILQVHLASSFDTTLSIGLRDIRLAQCFEDNLLPPRDCNDLLQSWNADIQVQVTKSFKSIAVEMKDERGLNISLGYRDIQIVLACLDNLLPAKHSESTELVESSIIPQIQVPLFVTNDLSVSVSMNLNPIRVMIVSDFSKVEVPFVQLVLSDLALKLDLYQELIAVVEFQLACDFYNQSRVAWEPLIEPWSLMVQLIQRAVDEKQKDAVGNHMWQTELLPTQTSCTIRSDTLLNADISAAFCSTAFSLLRDFNHYTQAVNEVVTESGYYLYVENQLGMDCEMEVVYDGGMVKKLDAIRNQWKAIETKQAVLKKEGFVFCMIEESVELLWMRVNSTEPYVQLFVNQVDDQPLYQSLPGTMELSSESSILLTCQLTVNEETKKALVFATVPAELNTWRTVLSQHTSLESEKKEEETLTIHSGCCVRTSLPAHPSFLSANSVESYNQRLISIRLPHCRPIECCCDYEDTIPFSITSQTGEYLFDIVVHVINRSGRRVILLSSLISIHNSTHIPLECRFVTDEEAGELVGTPLVKQSQKKQVNLIDLNDNYYGTPVSIKSPAFDKESKGVAIRLGSKATKPFTTMGFDESLYCPVENRMKGHLELKNTALNSIRLSDMTSLNLRRTVLNLGTSSAPHYVLLRCEHTKVTGEMVKSIQPSVQPNRHNGVLAKIAEETVNDVYGMVHNQRCIFSLELVPILTLHNALPMDMEYKVVMIQNNRVTPIHQGCIPSTQSEEVNCILPDSQSQYGFLLRPKSTQYVWNQQVLPMQLHTSGQYLLSDMENSQTSLQYEYLNRENHVELLVYSQYLVVNRTNDLLFVCGKKESQGVKLAANDVKVEFESTASLESKSLQPVLFSGKEKKPVLRIRKSNTEWSSAVKMIMNESVKGCIEACLPYTVTDTYYSVTLKRMNEPFSKSCLITISPYYLFVNRTPCYLTMYDQQSLLTLPPYSCSYNTSMKPANQHLLSFTAAASEDAISQEAVHSSLFDCDSTQHYDIVLKDSDKQSLFSVDTAFINENQTITILPLKPESISYCIVNNTCLSVVRVLQVSTDLSSAVSLPPLSSQMYILNNQVSAHEVGLFFHPIHLEEGQGNYQPRCLVDLDKIGDVTTFVEENPRRKIHVHIEVENSTNMLIIDEEVITESNNIWKEKKKMEYSTIVIAETLSKAIYELNTTTKEVTDYVTALKDFEEHASQSISLEGTVVKQPAVILSKESAETIDLMLEDSYYCFFIRNVSICNLQRKPCAIQLRCSNGETMVETDLIRGSHVFVNKQVLFKESSTEFHVKVIIQFEKKNVEFDVFVPFSTCSEFNKVQLLTLPFGSKGEFDSVVKSEERSLCDGGCVFLYCVHCKNNRINDNQKGYLPELLYKQFILQSQIEELWRAQSFIQYEESILGLNVTGSKNHIFIEQALHEGIYSNRDESTPFTLESAVKMAQFESEQEESADDLKEIESDKLLRVELETVYNLPHSAFYQASILCNEQEFVVGESKEMIPLEQYSSEQQTIEFNNVYIGCKLEMDEKGQYVVKEVEMESEADKKGVRVGMTLWGINGKMVDVSVSDLNQRIEALNRPLSLTFLSPYRNPAIQYCNARWNSIITLPKGSALGCDSLKLVIKNDSNTIVFNQVIAIQRYNDWRSVVSDSSSVVTAAVIKTHWMNETLERRMIDTSVNLYLKGIGVSVFNSKPIEVLNMVVEAVTIEFKSFNNQKQSVAMNIQTIQIDNQLLNAMEPVLVGVANPSIPAFSLSCTLPYSSSFISLEDVSLSLAPLIVSMDNHLLVAIMELIGDLPLHYLTNSENGAIFDTPEFQSVSLVPDSLQSSVHLFTNHLCISDLVVSVGMKVDPAVNTTSIFLPQVPYLIFLQTFLDTLCSLVADIDATKISLSSFAIDSYFASMSDFVSRLISFYLPQVTKQVLKIIGSANLIGNPVGLVEDVSSGIKAFIDPLKDKDAALTDKDMNKRLEEGGKTLLRNTTKGVFNTASKITGTVGNGVASLTFNKHYKEQRVLGRKGLIHGITSGVTGVVMDPIRGAKKNGLMGAVEGVGIGLIGVVTKPFSGLLDDTARILSTVKNAAMEEVKLKRVRNPVCVLCDRILRKYDKHLAMGQMLFFTGTTRFRIDEMKDEQYVFHCCVDHNSHYFIVTQYHCILLNSNCDLLWWMPLKSIRIEVDEEEMRILSEKESKLVLFDDKEVCSRLFGILINIPNWTNKEIVQCSQGLVTFINSKYSKENEVQQIYNQTTVDFRSLDILSVCMIAVDSRYERKFTGNYSIKANSYQEYCLEIVGGMEGTPMVSWRVYKRYSELREYYKSIEGKMTKDLKSVKFPGKKIQILGSHLNSNALQQREEQMQKFVDQCMNAPVVMNLAETKHFLTQDPVNVKYEV